jgi:hypothetical protein
MAAGVWAEAELNPGATSYVTLEPDSAKETDAVARTAGDLR